MSRSTSDTRLTSSTPDPAADSLPMALSEVAAAAAADQPVTFKDKVALARANGASAADIVGAYAEGGLHRLDRGLPAISFGWTGQAH